MFNLDSFTYRNYLKISVYVLSLLVCSCVTQFIPEITGEQSMLVVEGLITDQPVSNKIKIYRTVPLNDKIKYIPETGATVNIKDNLNNNWILNEVSDGVYSTDSLTFRGIPGREYALIIRTFEDTYMSPLVEMKPIPPIDSVYYEKVLLKYDFHGYSIEGCKIYLDTHDPSNETRYFRWDYTETWEMKFPWENSDVVENGHCWITDKSRKILIKSTALLAESNVSGFSLLDIGTEHDNRLMLRYSILVNQYSISEDEYYYWDKLKRVYEDAGSLYDLIPVNITGNIKSISDPEKLVFGNFSVSAVTSGRIYIDEYFKGPNFYWDCIDRYVSGPGPGTWRVDFMGYRLYTTDIECIDCTYWGTTERPDFWTDH